MTELYRARAHLRRCQQRLSHNRRCNYSWVRESELHVLAALSWLWEEQEKAARADCVNAIFALANAKWKRRADFPPQAFA